MQKLDLTASVRLGRTMVEVLQYMFPGRHDKLTSERGWPDGKDDTLFLPIIFSPLDDWYFDWKSGEVTGSQQFFAQVASLLAFEVVSIHMGPQRNRDKGILVTSFLNRFLDGLKFYLEQCLFSLCQKVLGGLSYDERQRLPTDPYCFTVEYLTNEAKVIDFAAIEKSGGRDAYISLFCIPRRHVHARERIFSLRTSPDPPLCHHRQ